MILAARSRRGARLARAWSLRESSWVRAKEESWVSSACHRGQRILPEQ